MPRECSLRVGCATHAPAGTDADVVRLIRGAERASGFITLMVPPGAPTGADTLLCALGNDAALLALMHEKGITVKVLTVWSGHGSPAALSSPTGAALRRYLSATITDDSSAMDTGACGVCINSGEAVALAISPDRTFPDYLAILLHELAHVNHSHHGPAFQAREAQLRYEYGYIGRQRGVRSCAPWESLDLPVADGLAGTLDFSRQERVLSASAAGMAVSDIPASVNLTLPLGTLERAYPAAWEMARQAGLRAGPDGSVDIMAMLAACRADQRRIVEETRLDLRRAYAAKYRAEEELKRLQDKIFETEELTRHYRAGALKAMTAAPLLELQTAALEGKLAAGAYHWLSREIVAALRTLVDASVTGSAAALAAAKRGILAGVLHNEAILRAAGVQPYSAAHILSLDVLEVAGVMQAGITGLSAGHRSSIELITIREAASEVLDTAIPLPACLPPAPVTTSRPEPPATTSRPEPVTALRAKTPKARAASRFMSRSRSRAVTHQGTESPPLKSVQHQAAAMHEPACGGVSLLPRADSDAPISGNVSISSSPASNLPRSSLEGLSACLVMAVVALLVALTLHGMSAR